MSRRITKQILYGLFYAACWGAIGFFIYGSFLRSSASCTNNRQDSGEEGIDCGGRCANACLPTDLKIIEQVEGIRIFRPNLQTMEVLAKIQNANFSFAARSFNYRFTIYGSGDQLLDTITGTSFIYGGDVKYLAAIRTGVSYIPLRAELIIDEEDWVEVAGYPRPVLGGIQEKNVRTTTSTIEVSGKIGNKDVVAVRDLIITALFHDQFGFPAGVSQTEIDHLDPEETKSFSIFHPSILDLDPEQTEILVTAQRQ